MKKLFSLLLVVMILSMLVPMAAFAQGDVACAEEVTVQKDDSLSKLADKYFGNVLSWPALMYWENAAAKANPEMFSGIANADVIEVGQTLCVPSEADATAFLATYDPAKPEMLFAGGAAGKLVIGSWWTAGGEAEGLNEMFRIYSEKYPDVEIVNATVAGGAGTNFKAVLKTRLLGGDPPDTFQLHAGKEVQTYSPMEYLQPLDDLYAAEGYAEVFPADLMTLLDYEGHFWGVPVNIHRSNVMWYDKAVFEANGVTPPTNMDEFKQVAATLQAAGIVPFVIGTNGGWEAAQVFEDLLAGELGPEKYKGLWTGDTSWNDPGVTQSLEDLKLMMSYANTDHPALSWDGAAEYLIGGKGGMMIMGDWADGWFTSKGYTGYGWAPSPGTKGTFVALSDSFALPAAAPDMENAIDWLKVCGSKEGQEAFNPKKGSICARTDCDPALFNAYLQSAMVDWGQDAIVPSMVHGAAAIESWLTEYKDIVALYLTSGDVAAAQTALQQACVDAGTCM